MKLIMEKETEGQCFKNGMFVQRGKLLVFTGAKFSYHKSEVKGLAIVAINN